MEKFYVASSFKNIEMVRFVSNQLKNEGFIQTYDWTRNDKASTIEDLKNIAYQEKNAVMESDFIIVLLPAGKGSHIELGIAFGLGKRIYIYSRNDEVNKFEITSTFYHLSEVHKCIGTIEELVEKVISDQMLLY